VVKENLLRQFEKRHTGDPGGVWCPYNTLIRDTPMTATFAQFQAEQDAKNTIYLNIVKYGMMLCDALTHAAPDGYGYELNSSGRKYHKIFMCIEGKRDSIHAFIDKKTGEVYKPASLKAPAKGVRFDLRLISDREYLFANADWAGSYLYAR